MTNWPPEPRPPASPEVAAGPELEPPPPTAFDGAPRVAPPTIWATPAIVAANVLVFAAMVATGVSPTSPTTGDIFKWGANFGPAAFLEGQWWRLLTAAFVHIGILHIALNMYVFWGAGRLAERLYGAKAFLALYLVAAVGGSLVSTLWSPLTVSAGASGAVFGVYGGLLAFARSAGPAFPPQAKQGIQKGVFSFVLYNLIFGFTVPNISNSAHLGGLATGFLAGWLLAPDHEPMDGQNRRPYWRIAALVPVLGALAYGTHHRIAGMPSVRADRLAEDARTALQAKDWDRARNRIDEAIALDPDSAGHYVLRAYSREMTKDLQGAISDLGEAIQREPKSGPFRAMRCRAFYLAKDLDRAAQDCDAAIKVDINDSDAWHLRTEILRAKGRSADAIAAARNLTRIAPGNAHAHQLLASLLYETGDLGAAEAEIAKTLAIDPKAPGSTSLQSTLMMSRGDYAAALKVSDQEISNEPQNPWAYSRRARVFRAQHDLGRALSDEDHAVELDPENGGWHNDRAWTLLQLDRLPEGLEAVNRSLALEPDSYAALGTRCWIQVSLGNRAAGKADCERAVKLWPEGAVDRGMIDFLEGRYSSAAAAWRRESQKDPSDAPFLGTWVAKAEALAAGASRAR